MTLTDEQIRRWREQDQISAETPWGLPTLWPPRPEPQRNTPRLPIEIWERVFDWFASDFDSAEPDESLGYFPLLSLHHCSMVCKSWVSRCRFHLLRNIHFTSALHYADLTSYVNSAPDLKMRVQKLKVEILSHDREVLAWISSALSTLYSFANLRKLILSSIEIFRNEYRNSVHLCVRMLAALSSEDGTCGRKDIYQGSR